MSYTIVKNLQNWIQVVQNWKCNYFIQGNIQYLLHEYSETYKYSVLQNVEVFFMLQRVLHICTTGF
jgi:hypothetical protein